MDATCSFQFNFSPALHRRHLAEHMTSADELFFNRQIRPIKLSTHLERPQILHPLIEPDDAFEDNQPFARGRDLKLRTKSLWRRTRSISPMRSKKMSFDRVRSDAEDDKFGEIHASSVCVSSSVRRSSKWWLFLKEFLYRSKSEGLNEGHKFWSFSPVNKEKMAPLTSNAKVKEGKKKAVGKNEGSKGRVISPSASAHELRYAEKPA